MIIRNYIKQWHNSSGRSARLLLVSIITLALCGCGSSRHMAREVEARAARSAEHRLESRDTVREIRSWTTASVAADTATLRIAPTSLDSLPGGASYVSRSGRAQVRVEYRDREIYVTATCDSLLREKERYERLYAASCEIIQARDSLLMLVRAQERKELRQLPGTVPAVLPIGVLTLAILVYVTKVKK